MIPFTQYLMPDGRQTAVTINRPAAIEELAVRLIGAKCRFEVEMLGDYQTISLEIVKPRRGDDPRVICGRLVPNGPEVPKAIDDMVNEAARLLRLL
jgi:hypothetical protein